MDLGLMVEGTLALSPFTGRLVVHFDGQVMDVQAALEKYSGQEIRLIATPLASVAEIAKLVESGEVEIPGM